MSGKGAKSVCKATVRANRHSVLKSSNGVQIMTKPQLKNWSEHNKDICTKQIPEWYHTKLRTVHNSNFDATHFGKLK